MRAFAPVLGFICAVLMLHLTGCAPTNQLHPGSPYNGSVATNIGINGLLSSTNSDGAQGQCLNFDPGTTSRSYCISCYDSILTNQCAGATSPSGCIDPNVRNNFPQLVNQCISNSIVAGFTCSLTCGSGQVVNAITCTCVTAPSGSNSGSGTGPGQTDAGQFDFGPPVVSAQWPAASPIGQSTGATAATNCSATLTTGNAILFSILNRGGTMFRSNHYGTPTASAQPDANEKQPGTNPATLYDPMVTNASTPASYFNSSTPTVNAYSTFTFQSGGLQEFINNDIGNGATQGGRWVDPILHDVRYISAVGPYGYQPEAGAIGGYPGVARYITGVTGVTAGTNGISASVATVGTTANGNNTVTNVGSLTGISVGDLVLSNEFSAGTTVTGTNAGANTITMSSNATADNSTSSLLFIHNRTYTDIAASAMHWNRPGFGARDRYGNVYFGDESGFIRVICYDVNGAGTNHWCAGQTKGHVYTIAGGGSQPLSASSGNDRFTLQIVQPGGIAVDQYGNVFFTDAGDNDVGVLCAGASGICSGGGAANRAYYILGASSPGANTLGGLAPDTSAAIASPWGIDIETSGANANIIIANLGTEPEPAVTLVAVPPTRPAGYPNVPLVAETAGAIVAACMYDPGAGPCNGGAGTPVTLANPGAGNYSSVVGTGFVQQGFHPYDVKINWNENIFFSDHLNSLIWARCYQGGTGDLCNASGAGALLRIAGNGIRGDAGDHGLAASSMITSPTAILIGKPYGDATPTSPAASPVARFFDNNVIFTSQTFPGLDHSKVTQINSENYYPQASGTNGNASGSAIRVICGNDTPDAISKLTFGFCKNVPAGQMIKLGGMYATIPQLQGGAVNGLATQTAFTNPFGLAYDGYKNLVFSSTGFDRGYQIPIADNTVNLIHLAVISQRPSTIQYTFTDSNLLTSTYCLKVKTITACYSPDGVDTCSCELTQPIDPSEPFWSAGVPNQLCY